MREKTVYLSVCMTPQQLAKLSELAKRTERTKGAVLRLLIDGTSVEELERLATHPAVTETRLSIAERKHLREISDGPTPG